MTLIPDGFHGAALPLTVADIERVAAIMGIEPNLIWSVSEVESTGRGFLDDGRPQLLFEAHQFHNLTGGRWDDTHPDISSSVWPSPYGAGGAHQYERLTEAMALNREAALQAATWGMFQVLGSNFSVAGFASVDSFVAAMCLSAGAHLDAFAAYCEHKGLVDFLRLHDWHNFKLGYNGPGADDYAAKLAAAFAAVVFPPPGMPAGPAAPAPTGGGDGDVISLPLGEQCSFPVFGWDQHDQPMSLPIDALTSDDPQICSVMVDGGFAIIASIALGQTTLHGPQYERVVTVVGPAPPPPILTRITDDLTKLVYSQIGAAVARTSIVACCVAVALAIMMQPAGDPAVLIFPPSNEAAKMDIVFAPLAPAQMPRLYSVFDTSTFCWGADGKIVTLARGECHAGSR